MAIQNYVSLETLIKIPDAHMRFVPIHELSDEHIGGLPPAKWRVEFVIISNEAGKSRYLNTDRVKNMTAPVLRSVCQLSTDKILFFPHTPSTSAMITNHKSGKPTWPITIRPATITP